MERRVLLAISLSFMVLFLYQIWVVPPPGPASNIPSAVPTTTAQPVEAANPAPVAGVVTAPIAPMAPVVPAAALIVGDSAEREVVVETQKVRAVFTNRGARLRHWILKDFRDRAGEPLDLVPRGRPGVPTPFSLRADGDANASTLLNDVLYRLSEPAAATVDATTTPATLTFEAQTADGLKARKVFTLDPANYVIQFTAEVERDGKPIVPVIEWGPGLGDEIASTQPGSFLSPSYVYQAQAIYQLVGENDAERVAASAIGGGTTRDGQFRWVGIDDHYFISAVLQTPPATRIEYVPASTAATTTQPRSAVYVAYAVKLPSPPENVKFYFGPKDLETLRVIDPEFTRAIYFGIFAFLAAPLLDALKWVQGFVGNWGWSIIVLTILINLALAPLRHKSVVSMRRMQELQPQMKAIQDRYAQYKITDPERQKMNTEVMELYRAKGVNPASGCVPMLLTLPFLFAFYAMLSQAIEIRGADFWWIRDLAAADPLYIIPALMGLTMFWQQKITPTTADPTQQKIMMFMPIMISVTMLFAPAGLVLYWLVSNIWAIGQQYFTIALLGPPRVPGAGVPSAARSFKSARNGAAGSTTEKLAKSQPPDIVIPPTRGKK